MSIILKTPSNGSVTLAEQDTASDVVVTVPAVTATLLNNSSGVMNIGSGQVVKDAAGNLGLGVTPSAWGSAFKALQSGASGVSSSIAFQTNDSVANLFANAYFDGSSYKYINSSQGASQYRVGHNTGTIGSGFAWFTAPSGTAGNAISFTQAMTLDSSGNLLVGKQTTAVNGVGFQVSTDNSYTRVFLSKTFNGAVNGLLNYHNGAYVGGINYDNTSTTFPTSSDVRLKKDIVDAPSATQKIDNIRIVSHGWKHDDAVVEFGVIAQELVSVAPNAVMQGDDGEEVVTTWSVDYSKLVPLLIKAHQEQQAIIIEQQAALTQLQADVAALQGAA